MATFISCEDFMKKRTQVQLTCSKLTIGTLKKGVKYAQC